MPKLRSKFHNFCSKIKDSWAKIKNSEKFEQKVEHPFTFPHTVENSVIIGTPKDIFGLTLKILFMTRYQKSKAKDMFDDFFKKKEEALEKEKALKEQEAPVVIETKNKEETLKKEEALETNMDEENPDLQTTKHYPINWGKAFHDMLIPTRPLAYFLCKGGGIACKYFECEINRWTKNQKKNILYKKANKLKPPILEKLKEDKLKKLLSELEKIKQLENKDLDKTIIANLAFKEAMEVLNNKETMEMLNNEADKLSKEEIEKTDDCNNQFLALHIASQIAIRPFYFVRHLFAITELLLHTTDAVTTPAAKGMSTLGKKFVEFVKSKKDSAAKDMEEHVNNNKTVEKEEENNDSPVIDLNLDYLNNDLGDNEYLTRTLKLIKYKSENLSRKYESNKPSMLSSSSSHIPPKNPTIQNQSTALFAVDKSKNKDSSDLPKDNNKEGDFTPSSNSVDNKALDNHSSATVDEESDDDSIDIIYRKEDEEDVATLNMGNKTLEIDSPSSVVSVNDDEIKIVYHDEKDLDGYDQDSVTSNYKQSEYFRDDENNLVCLDEYHDYKPNEIEHVGQHDERPDENNSIEIYIV